MKTHHPLLALITALASMSALAQADPWYVGLTQTLAHDSNLFRLPAASAQSSGTISVTQLVGGLDLRPGRQHLFADVRLGHNRYGSQHQLDFDGYGLKAGLDWDTVNQLSGRLVVSADKRQGSFSAFSTPTGVGRNVEQLRSLDAEFRLGDYSRSRLWFVAELSHDDQTSDVDLQVARPLFGEPAVLGYERRLRTTGAGFGARTRVGGGIVLGLGLHGVRGDENYDLRSLLPGATSREDSFERRDIDFTASWDPRGNSRLDARLSYGSTDSEHQLFRADRKGWTGSLRWDWTPTGKLATQAQLGYETNARGRLGTDDTANEPVFSVNLSARYAISAKLSANAGLRHQSRKVDTVNSADDTDRRQGANFGLDWAAMRNLALGCTVARDSGNQNVASGGYRATSTSCTVRAVLQ